MKTINKPLVYIIVLLLMNIAINFYISDYLER
jgi:hypothetical protein